MPRDANEIYGKILKRKLEAAVTDAMPLALAGDFDGAANASPAAIQQTKWFLASVVLVQVLSLVSSISLLSVGRDWLACGAGILPVPYAVGLVAVLVKLEW